MPKNGTIDWASTSNLQQIIELGMLATPLLSRRMFLLLTSIASLSACSSSSSQKVPDIFLDDNGNKHPIELMYIQNTPVVLVNKQICFSNPVNCDAHADASSVLIDIRDAEIVDPTFNWKTNCHGWVFIHTFDEMQNLTNVWIEGQYAKDIYSNGSIFEQIAVFNKVEQLNKMYEMNIIQVGDVIVFLTDRPYNPQTKQYGERTGNYYPVHGAIMVLNSKGILAIQSKVGEGPVVNSRSALEIAKLYKANTVLVLRKK